jgi:hypothetical protein
VARARVPTRDSANAIPPDARSHGDPRRLRTPPAPGVPRVA